MLNTITIALLIAVSILIVITKFTEPGRAKVIHKGNSDYCGNCKEKLYPQQKYCPECGFGADREGR